MDKNYLDLEIPSPALRIIDANLNRFKEGIRVVEDIRRFYFNDKENAQLLKNIRHEAKIEPYVKILDSRDIVGDVLKTSTIDEKKRENVTSIQLANIKRAQESARVLEEILKLYSEELSEKFKLLRYKLYSVEKKLLSSDA